VGGEPLELRSEVAFCGVRVLAQLSHLVDELAKVFSSDAHAAR
jgi:hypothetical protein